MEEKKTEDRNLENEIAEEAVDKDVTDSETAGSGASEERRGLFGAKKRERNDRAMMMVYVIAGIYLLYTAYSLAKELINGQVEPGRNTIINIAFIVIFGGAAAWILFSSWRIRNMLKAQEEEEAKKLAEEMAERGETPEKPSKGGLLGGILVNPEQPSVASRAAAYYNPADDEERSGEDEADEEGKADDVAESEAAGKTGSAGEVPDHEAYAETDGKE